MTEQHIIAAAEGHTSAAPARRQPRQDLMAAAETYLGDKPSPALIREAARRLNSDISQLADRLAHQLSNRIIDTDR